MRLIDVDAVLRIVHPTTHALRTDVLQCFDVHNDRSLMDLDYAILSHRWRGEEITFEDINNLTTNKLWDASGIWYPSGYKLVGSCRVAHGQGIKWLWIDSCCISDNTKEREQAINSMYRWYRCSKTCYTYLHDVADNSLRKVNGDTKWSEWFSRGWTLQELIAPTVLIFFNRSWQKIGDKGSLASTLHDITRIPKDAFQGNNDLRFPRQLTERFGVAQVMSWAADRETSQPDDRAYSLVGLFGVSLDKRYGEEEGCAFQRLQEALIMEYGDQSIFSWSGQRETGSVLADSPSDFRNCTDVIKWVPPSRAQSRSPRFQLGQGFVTTQLQLTRCRGSSYIFQANLACCRKGHQSPIVITLAELNDVYYRILGDFIPSDETEEREIDLWCRPVPCSFTFDVSSSLGAITLGGDRWERDFAYKTMSLTNAQHEVIHYRHVSTSHPGHDKSFAIILGFFIHLGSVHVEHDGPSGKITHDVLHHINCIDRSQRKIATNTWSEAREVELVMHSHIPRTIQAVKVIYKRKGWCDYSVSLNVVRCVGCCMPGWVSVDWDLLRNNEIAECFRRIRQSYLGSLPNMVTTGNPLPEVDIIVKSFVVKVLTKKASGLGLKKLFLKLPCVLMLERNKNLSEAEKEYITRFFAQITTSRQYEADILAYEPLNVSLISVISEVGNKLILKHSIEVADSHLKSTRKNICTLQAEIDSLNKLARTGTELERALEEDIVGRILLLFWNGISDGISCHPELNHDLKRSVSRNSVSYIFKKAFMEASADGGVSHIGPCPLKRIMEDARDGISKYKLLVEECAG